MKRKAIYLASNKSETRKVYIDEINKKNIIDLLSKDERYKKKFRLILQLLLDNHRNTELYDKENINDKCKDVYAIKLFKGQENHRIYCKQTNTGKNKTFVIILSELNLSKKTQKNSHKEISLIQKVATYEYEFIEKI